LANKEKQAPFKKQRATRVDACQDSEVSDGADFLVRLVHKPWFEFVSVFLILLNCPTVMLEAQYVGYKVGHNLGFPKYETSASEKYPWVESIHT